MPDQLLHIADTLTPLYGRQEAYAMARWIAEEPAGSYDAAEVLRRLQEHEPLQYVFGHTDWYGLRLCVTPDTLIPRPETAGIVDAVEVLCGAGVLPAHGPLTLADIGTGTGCIAIKIKHRHPAWDVQACDISDAALSVARANAADNGAAITLFHCDILNHGLPRQYDVIVSNPPYICSSERSGMPANVLRYEPAAALFVPDDDPLLFYRRIARLQEHAVLVFEINERFGALTGDMLRAEGYTDITLTKDLCGKDRIITARR